ncbi:ATPase associated with various cellular activities AAA_3 [Thiorhodococcus drewsii AZ1]|uniref:ATPase associated with various cellular activities AAA_3 n=1 Tax=Thiorhodococcus drewsii AZ1 TaxID=765913 RepID=G2DWM1_9GAMM|nr:ATPase associated with various cellular activities AAA_3 [Thiorhodococcus drewsii AZ1]
MTLDETQTTQPNPSLRKQTGASGLAETFSALREQIGRNILGQRALIDRLLIALLADGHLLVEGAPGLAKTTAVKQLALGLEGDFHRIQFTPDLLPADLTGTEIYRPNDGSFRFDRGPIFHNLLLADEVNRAPAKVQSALLEAMGERQVTVGRETYALPPLFLVMATQNPIEQEGTYPLPEAQLDRFLLHVRVDYPDLATERAILRLTRDEARGEPPETSRVEVSQSDVFAARQAILGLYMAPEVEDYLVHLVMATRNPGAYAQDLDGWLRFGASPRATIALDRCSRALAWLSGRDYVSPEDVQTLAPDVLRHRVLLSYEAEAAGHSPDAFIAALLARVPAP